MRKLYIIFAGLAVATMLFSSCVRQSSHCKAAHKRKKDFDKIQYR